MIYGLDVYRPGVGWLQGEPERLTLSTGDILQISVSVPYRGPAKTYTLYASIGQRGFFGFDEILSARSALLCPESPDEYTAVTGEVDIEITSSGFGISAGVNYDLYVKIEEQPEIATEIDNIIDIEGNTGGSTGMTDMLGMLMPLMMMGMVLPMVSGEQEE